MILSDHCGCQQSFCHVTLAVPVSRTITDKFTFLKNYVTETLKSHQDTYQLSNTQSTYSHITPPKNPVRVMGTLLVDGYF